MISVYAEVGSSLQQIGGECPDGWVVMQGERPTPEHVAREDGSWAIVPVVPERVSMRQARLAMLFAGILYTVEGIIRDMPGEDGEAARIEWGYALDVRRDWPLVAALGEQIGMTKEQVDDLFIYAASIPAE